MVFDAFWVKGLDIGDASVLGELGCPTGPPRVTMQWWHDEWLGFDRPVVPMVSSPVASVSRGSGALKRLVELGIHGRASR